MEEGCKVDILSPFIRVYIRSHKSRVSSRVLSVFLTVWRRSAGHIIPFRYRGLHFPAYLPYT